MEINRLWSRIFGVFGIIGGIVLFSGDMLFYYDPINTNLYENMGKASDSRLIGSTISALIAAWLYVLGSAHVYQAFITSKTVIKNLIFACFVAISVSYGVVHGAFMAIAASSKLAIVNNLDLNQAVTLAVKANNMLRFIVYPIFGLLSFLFIVEVWNRRSSYPRWIIFFFPLIPFLLQDFICKNLSGSISIVICGGYLNLILIVFFIASSIALWNKKY